MWKRTFLMNFDIRTEVEEIHVETNRQTVIKY